MNNKANKILLASGLSTFLFISQIFAQTVNFVDIRGYWAEQYITALAERGIIGGFPDRSFQPNAEITRAQFASIVAKAFNLSPSLNTRHFIDVPSSYWASSAIRAVSNSGLVTGFPDGTFRPEERITRVQVLVILAKALGNKATSNANEINRYLDRQAVPDWATESVSKAANAGIIVNFPDPSRIEPNNLATRGEVAALMYQTLFKLGERNLTPLTIGTLDSASSSTPPVASNLVIERIKINIKSHQVLTNGEELLVTAYGTPSATASFRLEGLNQNKFVAMIEVERGIYKGRYTIRRNDRTNNSYLTVTLSKQGTRSVTREFNQAIAINSNTNENNNNRQTLKPEIINFNNNDVVNFPVDLVGQTLPKANVKVILDALNSVVGIVEVSQTLFKTTVRADEQGRFVVHLPSNNLASSNRYRVRLTATKNNQSQSNELFLRQN